MQCACLLCAQHTCTQRYGYSWYDSPGFSGGSPPSQREANAAARRLLNETSKAWIEERQRQFEQGGTRAFEAKIRQVGLKVVAEITAQKLAGKGSVRRRLARQLPHLPSRRHLAAAPLSSTFGAAGSNREVNAKEVSVEVA